MNEIHHTFGRAILDNMEKVQDTRTVTFELSNETVNRKGAVNLIDRWKIDNFNGNGIVGYQHNVYGDNLCDTPNPDDVIGSGKAWIDQAGRRLMGSATFETKDINPLADKIFQKVTVSKTLKAVSVGFMELKEGETKKQKLDSGEEQEIYYYGDMELLEFSVVNIPANAKALRQSFRDSTYNALAYVKRILGGAYSYADIEKMTVRDVLRLVENPGDTTAEDEEKIIEKKKLIDKTKRKLKLLEYEF